MNNEFYLQLLHKRLTGEISSEDNVQLEEYLNAHPDEKKLADEIELSWDLSLPDSEVPSVDVNAELGIIHKKLGFNEVKQETKTRSLFSSNVYKIAATVVLVLSGAAIIFNNYLGTNNEWQEIYAEDSNTPIELEDGTKVWLSKKSVLAVRSENFNSARQVKLTGSAFFDVQKSGSSIFTITANDVNVEVLGTSFNVSSYTNSTEVHVKTGVVRMSYKDEQLLLKRGDAGALDKKSEVLSTIAYNDPEDIPWKSGRFVFRNTTVENAINQIQKEKEISITIDEESVKACELSAVFQTFDTKEILHRIAEKFDMRVTVENESSYMLYGGSCK